MSILSSHTHAVSEIVAVAVGNKHIYKAQEKQKTVIYSFCSVL